VTLFARYLAAVEEGAYRKTQPGKAATSQETVMDTNTRKRMSIRRYWVLGIESKYQEFWKLEEKEL
jgi:hypothetical protein